jgi:anti-sigma factor RsiW
MREGYNPEDHDSIDDALDELLCEYVDGSMDPDVRVVFEEYLATDAKLAAHVRQLCETRNMLCSFGACKCASAGLQAQLRVRLAGEFARKNRSSLVISSRLGRVALLTSAVGLTLIVGMMAGLLTVVQRTSPDAPKRLLVTAATEDMTPRVMETHDDAHGATGPTFRLDDIQDAGRSTFLGPVTALPVVAGVGSMTPSGALRYTVVERR